MTLLEFIDNVNTFTKEEELCLYLRENFEDIHSIFNGDNYETLYQNRFKISDLYYNAQKLLISSKTEIIAFNSILADFFERF